MDYDIFAGVSSGSVNSCELAMYKKGETEEALEHMADFTRWFEPQQYMQNFENPLGFKEPFWLSATIRQAAADWTDGWPKFKVGLDKPMQRPCRVGASDLLTGNVFSFKVHELPFEKQLPAIIASCSLPVAAIPPDEFGPVLVDGGIYAAINLQDAIDECRQIVDDDKHIYIDINVCGASVNEHQEIRKLERQSHFNVWNIHKQVEDLYAFYLANEDWLPILYANPDINLRNFIIPREHIEGSLYATGTTDELMDRQEAQGYQVGADAARGVNQYMKEILVKHWDDYVDSITREGFD